MNTQDTSALTLSDCCEEFKSAIEDGTIYSYSSGEWGVAGCCGNCDVLSDIQFCPFCGARLKKSRGWLLATSIMTTPTNTPSPHLPGCPCAWCKVERDNAPPPPDEMMRKAADGLRKADWMNWDEEYSARIALTAAGVPGLLAKVERLRSAIATALGLEGDLLDLYEEASDDERIEMLSDAIEEYKKAVEHYTDTALFNGRRAATAERERDEALQAIAELQPEAALEREAALLDRAEKAERERDDLQAWFERCGYHAHPDDGCGRCQAAEVER